MKKNKMRTGHITHLVILGIIMWVSLNAFLSKAFAEEKKVALFDGPIQSEVFSNSDLVPFSTYYADKISSQERNEVIVNIFTKANKNYLEGNLDDSFRFFLEVSNFSHQQDWNEEGRKTIHSSFLRLYQITKDVNWIERAVEFDVGLSPIIRDLSNEDQKLFLNRQQARQSFMKNTVWPDEVKEFDIILINGRRYQTTELDTLSVGPGLIRLTFISSRYRSFTRVIESKQIPYLKIPLAPLLQEGCKSSSITLEKDVSKYPFSGKIISASGNCDFIYNNGQILVNSPMPLAPLAGTPDLGKLQYTETRNGFFKRNWKWFAVGAVGVATFFVIRSMNKKEGKPETPALEERPPE